MLSKEAIIEYQQVYKKVYKSEISYKQALEEGTKLIRLMQLVYHSLPKDWKSKNEK